MGDISVPRSLTAADAALSFADSLTKLIDPALRAKIADDIKAHHALNETEAKKADDARSLIKKNQDILDETIRISYQNKKCGEELDSQRFNFKADSESERQRIEDKWKEVKAAAAAASNLHVNAEKMIADVEKRENALKSDKIEHEKNVNKLTTDRSALEKERLDIDEYKNKIIALDKTTNEKVDKLKQFNF